jgi:hypothetical protein
MNKSFEFKTQYTIPILLGIKARNLEELRNNIRSIPDASIYYHTHRFLKQHITLVPEPPNDFAYWVRTALNMKKFAEKIASINIVSCSDINELRNKLLSVFSDGETKDIFFHKCLKGDEFHFMSCKTICLSTGYKAKNIKEFLEVMGKIDFNPFFYHMFAAKLRYGKKYNDFSQWLFDTGEEEAAEKINAIDPYNMTLEKLRLKIIQIITDYAKNK